MLSVLVAALLGLSSLSPVAASQYLNTRSHDTHDYYALHIDSRTSPETVASHLGLELEGQIGDLTDHYLLKAPKHDHDLVKRAVRQHGRKRDASAGSIHPLDSVLLSQKQVLRAPHEKRVPPLQVLESRQTSGQPASSNPPTSPALAKGKSIAKELGIQDPIYSKQWHLYNPVQPGHDINVTGVWLQGITGKNSTVCIVDDGLDFESHDLADNYFAKGSYDFNDLGPEPKPRLSDDRHGTRCAGEVSAVKNDICGVGVAYESRIAGIRILSAPITDADEASAMTYGFQDNDIYSCSWGPPDNGQEMGAPGVLIKRAMLTAVQKGRGGRGTIYVFAAGNGALSDDNCNFDGYTNSIYSITVGAIDRKGNHPYYSEKCSAQMIVTYSSGSGDAIHTTDVGSATCYSNHGGTSAAGPLAAGVYALVLQVRPDLTWRDMQYLTLQNAVTLEVGNDWQNTSSGKPYSHQFGYGKLDAWRIVEAAKDFKSVKAQAWLYSPWQHIRHDIPQGNQGLSHNYTVTKEALEGANLERIEHVTVTMNVEHTRRGDISVELRSPSGVISHLSTARQNDNFHGGYSDWTFMSVAHWGESGVGDWTIVVKDTVENEHVGELVDWKINFFGECIDPKKQTLLPLPTEHDDDDHDREQGVPVTTSIAPTSTQSLMDKPSDHPDRPINLKSSEIPSAATSAAAVTTTAAFEAPILASTTSQSSVPTATHRPISEAEEEDDDSGHTSDNFLPSPFPTFGVSKKSQVWIYGALVLIVLFCLGLGAYLWVVKRRQRRQGSRDDYEFEVLQDDDDDEYSGSRKRGKRRAGELYDAFAGESDEELFSDDEKQYKDHDNDNPNSNEKTPLSSDEGSSSSGSAGGGGGKQKG